MTATYQGRIYALCKLMLDGPNLRRDLLARGFDGECYLGVSQPVGRERTVKRALFYREAKSGLFSPAAVMTERKAKR